MNDMYTHYLPRTGERGYLYTFFAPYLTRAKFEKEIGRLTSSFEEVKPEYPSPRSSFRIKLHTGEKFYFNSIEYTVHVFESEHGKFTQTDDLPVCATDPEKTTRVRLLTASNKKSVLTDFAPHEESAKLLTRIEQGRGALYTEVSGRQTVIPHHNILSATLVTAPYGG